MSALVEALQFVAGVLLIASAGVWVLAFLAGLALAGMCWVIGRKK